MSNHNSKSTLLPTTHHLLTTNRGFTLVEMLIIAPIVILVIGIFVSAIITMTGDVLAVRGKNALAFNIQDALNRIDQDVKSSGGYLATNNITLTSPQGYDDNTSAFKNADATNGTMLILNTYATTANPLSSTRNFVYTTSPNACNSALVSQNQKVAMNIIYFVKNNALWRRVIAPSSYATAGCSVPWQQPTCALGYVASFCKTQDMKLVDGVSASGFVLNYYTSAAATTPIANAVNNTLSDANRQTALQTASSVNVTITATKTLAGRDVSQSGTIRSSSPNTGTTSNSLALSNSGGGTWAYKRPITITNSSGSALTNYQVQINPFTDSTFINNTGLVGSWHLNEGSGTTTNDMSGNGNNGTLTGTTYWNGSGKFGSSFNGITANNNTATIANNTSLDLTTQVTTEAWIKTNSTACGDIVNRGNVNSPWQGYNFMINNTGPNKLSFYAGNGSSYGEANYTWDNNWHHVVGVFDGTYIRLYIDGNAVGTPVSQTVTLNYAAPINIGASNGGSCYFNGQIDEVKIYNRALSAAEIALRAGTAGVPKIRGDYADIRFTNSTGATEYSYWQEKDGKYWVKIPSLATGDTTINMYYGNPSATNSSSGTNTFDFFDDFNDGAAAWTAFASFDSPGVINATESGGVATLTGPSLEGGIGWPYTITNGIIEVKAIYNSRLVQGEDMTVIARRSGTSWYRYGPGWGNTDTIHLAKEPNHVQFTSAAYTYSIGTWRTLTFSLNGTSLAGAVNGTNTSNYTDSSYSSGTVGVVVDSLHEGTTGLSASFDDFRVRKFATTEPTHAAPGAETAP